MTENVFWLWQSISDLISAACNKSGLSPPVVRLDHVTLLKPGKRRAGTDTACLKA